jgi:hypothetical protein
VIIIGDDPTESDADNDDDVYYHDLNLSTQHHHDFGNADLLTKDHHKTEDIEDALNSELLDRPEYQDSRPRRPELSSAPSTPSTRSLVVAMEQQVNGDTLSENHVIMHEPQGRLSKGAEEHSKRTLLQSCFI